MKRFLVKYPALFVVAIALFAACRQSGNNTSSKGSNATDSLVNSSGATTIAEVRTGAQLITANDCLTCHSIDSVVKGPAFKTIAQKYHHYEGVVSNLSRSIISGSHGIWGDEVMTPHPNLSPAEASEMIQYIFSLDTTHTADTTGTYGSLKSKPVK